MRLSAPPREGRHAIFFALYPPAASAAEIVHLVQRLFEDGALSGPRVGRERLHISLNYLGHYARVEDAPLASICAAISEMEMTSFRLALNKIMSFDTHNGRCPRVLTGDDGLSGIFRLHNTIQMTLARARLICWRAPQITPHLTLSREAVALPDEFVAPIAWDVKDFCLVHSPQGDSRHLILGRWPLAARAHVVRERHFGS